MSRTSPSVVTSRAIRTLHPAYFAMVMSTGIISIAFEGLDVPFGSSIASVLFVVNVATYAVLLPMFLARLALFTGEFLEDVWTPRRSWGYFTFVVGTNTLGSQFVMFGDFYLVARVLWVLGLVSWIGFTYVIFTYLIAHHHDSVERIVSGATLLAVVSTESVAVLGSMLADSFGQLTGFVTIVSLTHFATGWVLYLILIALVTYRLLFRALAPADWTGPYWISMGAVAITTLAGSNILLHLDMGNLEAAILVVTYLAWAIGAWWIPILLYMDVWKFYRLNVSGDRPAWITLFPWFRLGFGGSRYHFYEPPSWGRVFPMGMFTAATLALSMASGFDLLYNIPALWGWFALVVWGLTFVGTLRAVRRTVTG